MSEEPTPSTDIEASPGQVVYDGDGNQLGRIQGFSGHGFEVSVHDRVPSTGRSSPFPSRRSLRSRLVPLEHDPGQGFGEGYITWRCAECGEMGESEVGIPETCPNCGAPEEDIYAWLED